MIRKAHLSLWLRSAKNRFEECKRYAASNIITFVQEDSQRLGFLGRGLSGLAEPGILWGDPPESDDELLLLTTLIGDKYLGTSIKSTS